MFRKLIKYDLKYTFKYWWIMALSSLGLSVMGGVGVRILNSDIQGDKAFLTQFFSVIALVLSVLGLSAFMLATMLFVYMRYYKNFFTDEGYLTFTLPVKRIELLNSKIIAAFLTNAATSAVLVLDIAIIFSIGEDSKVIPNAFEGISELFDMLFNGVAGKLPSAIFYPITGIALIVLSSLFSILAIFACITFASVITKKNKVLAAIGIYYLGSGIFSVAGQIITIFGMAAIAGLSESISKDLVWIVILLCLWLAVAFMAMICLLLYIAIYRMLDKKLNLA